MAARRRVIIGVMATTKIGIINGALTLCGMERVNAVIDGDTPSAHAAAEYDLIIDALFAESDWYFASVLAELEKTADISPYSDDYAIYGKPPLAVRVIRIFQKGEGDRSPVNFREDADGIHAPASMELTARYVKRLDEAQWEPHFGLAAQAALASKIAPNWAKDDLGNILEIAGRDLRRARMTDAKRYSAGRADYTGVNGADRFYGRGGVFAGSRQWVGDW